MGIQFLKAIIYFAEKSFEATVVDLEKEQEQMETEDVPAASGSGNAPVLTPIA